MENVEYISSSSDSDADTDSESRVMPTEELDTRRPKRRRLESATEPGSSFPCSSCHETLKADGKAYFLPFCGCLYCGKCIVQSILDGLLHLKSALGRAAVDLVHASADYRMKPPTSSINLLT
ncbi:hypothetical protein EJ07DRAFT_158923 [Lizonia empirigonia]|nr:hypothetical protein EJ07DRAFT_158923 [Lizonia empirigonia]